MKFAFLLLAWLLPLTAFCTDPLPVKITAAWVRAVPPSIDATAAFMRLENTGDIPLRLTGATTSIATMAMPMATTRKQIDGAEVLGMKAVDSIVVPAHSGHVLKPGGDHLMLMNLSSHPRPGEKVSITLEFSPGHQKLTVEFPARLDAP